MAFYQSAYKHADGKKIDGRRVLVDVERARTVKGWLPRRLGGGLGGTRRGGPDVNIKHSGREDNERERERYRLEREREAVRGVDRDRDRDRIDRERRRSRERKRRSRSRSRDRKRRRSRERVPDIEIEEIQRDDRIRDRRDRDRDRKRRRSRSIERERDRDRDRSKRDKRDRDRDRVRDRKERPERMPDEDIKNIQIKEEPLDDYPEYNSFAAQQNYFTTVKYEDGEEPPEEKYRIPENNRSDQKDRPYNYDSVQDY